MELERDLVSIDRVQVSKRKPKYGTGPGLKSELCLSELDLT